MIEIYATNSDDIFLISDRHSFLRLHSWSATPHQYAQGCIGVKRVYLHCVIGHERLGFPKDKEVDHIDLNPLNCLDENLRPATGKQNCGNQKVRKCSSSGVKGVFCHKRDRRWHAVCCGKWLGYFDTKKEASDAYDKEALIQFGEFARLNNYQEESKPFVYKQPSETDTVVHAL